MDKIKAVILGAFVILILTGMIGETAQSTSVGGEISFITYEEYRALGGESEELIKEIPVQPLGFNS